MAREKTRPQDNYHCFEGMGRPFWLSIAQGMQPQGMSGGPDGYTLDMARDVDGAIVQNGGMYAPQETKLSVGTYFRFFGTVAHNLYGAGGGMSGGWWLDVDNYVKVCDWAEEHDVPLAKAAQALLVIPKEWHDCGYVGRARLTRSMKAWVGKGKPATGSISPDSALRTPGTAVSTAFKHLELKQYFVPGERDLIAAAFQKVSTAQVTRKGTGRPLL